MIEKEAGSYDVTFVGCGISCTAVLLGLLDKLQKNSSSKHTLFKVAIIEKNPELWTGVAYGSRSSVNSLTITNFRDFIPPGEKKEFTDWLQKNLNKWSGEFKLKGALTSKEWLSKNFNTAKDLQWDEIYIPRYLFGQYLKEKISHRLKNAVKNKLIAINYYNGIATDISGKNKYRVFIQEKDGKQIVLASDKVVLCAGPPPIKKINVPGKMNFTSIDDIYDPSLPATLSKIKKLLTEVPEAKNRNILVMGSNASAIELLYIINSTPGIKKNLNKIVFLSPSGQFPVKINDNGSTVFQFENLERLKKKRSFSAKELMLAIRNDKELAAAGSISFIDVYTQFNVLVVQLLDKLADSEKRNFHCFYGADFSKLIRRTGGEYGGAVKSFQETGKLLLVKGWLTQTKNTMQGAGINYIPAGTTDETTIKFTFPVLINCGGSEPVNNFSSSELIANLIKAKICTVNCTNRGFKVNRKLEAAKNFYVMGPLLGGIFNRSGKLWHVENAKSIFSLANVLAKGLVEKSKR